MKKSAPYLFLLILSLVLFSACERNDDEPILPATVISRLYVSFSDLDTSDLDDPAKNIAVFDPFTAESFAAPNEYTTSVLEGAAVYFDPFAGRVFQGSFQNRTISHFSVSEQGTIGTGATSFRDSTLLSQRDLVYDRDSKNLYVSDNLAGSVFVYAQALNRNGEIRANKKFQLGGQPWGLHLSVDSIGGKDLFVVLAGDSREVQLLENVTAIDSGVVSTAKKISVAGATDLRGIDYSATLDLLVLSDFGSGKIYFIENARRAMETGGNITPDRTISGALSALREPIDVAIDSREDQLKIYVADRMARKLLRFNISDAGNVAPETSYDFSLTPVSIHIDAR